MYIVHERLTKLPQFNLFSFIYEFIQISIFRAIKYIYRPYYSQFLDVIVRLTNDTQFSLSIYLIFC